MVAVLRQQTTTIPIVFVSVSDPIGDGFVENAAPAAPMASADTERGSARA